MQTKEKDYYSLKDLCEELSVSYATVKNWLKLGKISSSFEDRGVSYFDADYTNELKSSLQTDISSALKSRRNKKFVSGTKFYDSYLSKNSKNIRPVLEIVEYFELNNFVPSDELIRLLIADCAIKLLKDGANDIKSYLTRAVKNEKGYQRLIDDILPDKKYYYLTDDYKELFAKDYVNEDNDILGLLYISCSNIKMRKQKGSYYTPDKIVRKLIENIDLKPADTVFDPCCGCGNFLLHLPENIKLENIYANDIDPICPQITRLNLAIKYKNPDTKILYKNITCGDYLKTIDNNFDYIIGNPPWGADFDKRNNDYIVKNYTCAKRGKFESYDVILEKALLNIKKGGHLSFILPESILNVKTHQAIRDIVCKNYSIEYIEYLGDVFTGVQCPSIILKIRNTQKPFDYKNITVNDGKRTFKITHQKIDNLLFTMTDEEYKIINKINTIKDRIFLKNNADFALGIVTGDNKTLVKKEPFRKGEVILTGKNISKYSIAGSYNYIKFEPDKFQQLAPIELYRAKEKLVYKFISNEPIFAYDNKKMLTLNSCNILIPKLENYDIKYILAILNSKIISFYFKKVFKSVKLLRSHIENFPIPSADINQQKEITMLVDKILNNYDENICKILDNKIAQVYGLSENERIAISKI